MSGIDDREIKNGVARGGKIRELYLGGTAQR
jgi:hypothetical protein